ncbi:molybdopterin oxidoreductase family protein [Demequina sp. SYSU T00039]|uniref:Molybdopterin oxidoreductase family protein n=1 Tax=Demequina lignilytica TaxID=3051663 RepID=A0AAW7M3J6_9MICO|nr:MULTISPECIES: molybdopterin oxidoreductase family protein [unclassified Demequina]MDN4478420.1 molybdopterin oxidoreductase family protein [Demequina sp. SYSU T00039-1]MDN4487073.1 molybdopterin oxidoreductase family protein [Demequina sp. SYSU T00039]
MTTPQGVAAPGSAPGAAVASHCPYCALQCAQTLTSTPGERLPVAVSGRQFPTNRGGLCQKGWTSAEVLRASDRITTPRIRTADGGFRTATWVEALDLVAGRIRQIQAESGDDAVAVFGGGGLTNEKAYALGKFARLALHTRLIDYNGRFCMSSAAAASNRTLGMDRGLAFPLSDLGGADAILILGSNMGVTMPPFVQHLAGVRERGGLIVVDPRATVTAKLAANGAGVHLAPVPGSDMVVLLALLHIVLAEGLADLDYLEVRVNGLDAVRRSVAQWWPERAEAETGIPADTLREVARLLAAASPSRGGRGAYILTGRGVEQMSQGTACVSAAINLALALGLVGREGSGYGPVTGQGNGQGGREHGQKSDQLPGYRMITDPATRAHVAAVWGVDPARIPGPGVPAVQLLSSLGTPGGPRALMVHGSNVVVSAPNATRVEERLKALDLLVVCDLVPSETALLADVILPVTQWAEEDGTMTNLEGRIIRRRAAVDAPGEARSELWILGELARRLGCDAVFSDEPEVMFDEMARASAGGKADYSGVTYARLDAGEELFWPVPAAPAGDAPHPGTPRPFLDRFPTPDGRATMHAVAHHGPADDVRPGMTTYLVTGRVLQHYQSGAQTRRVKELVQAQPEPFVEMHPLLAERYGLSEGAVAFLASERGEAMARVRLTTDIRVDTVFMPFHWAGAGSANRLTNDVTDPTSAMPEFKVTAVEIRAAHQLRTTPQLEGAVR